MIFMVLGNTINLEMREKDLVIGMRMKKKNQKGIMMEMTM